MPMPLTYVAAAVLAVAAALISHQGRGPAAQVAQSPSCS